MYQKDGQIFTPAQVRQAHPNISFAPSTYAELGYSAHEDQQEEQQAAPIQSVSARQMNLALLSVGLLDEVEAAVAASDRATQISWNRAAVFERANPLVIGMGAMLSQSDEQLDDLFRLAATL